MSKIWFSKTTIFDKITAAFSIGGGHSKPRRAGHKLTKRAKITLTLCTLALITTATILIARSPSTDSIQQLYIGSNQVKDIYVGNTPVNKVYLGDQLIWERAASEAQTGDDIQTVSVSNCPTDRTRVRDARDDATYWVRKITDTAASGGDLCWMETNLAYAGGGNNTYGDTTADIPRGTATYHNSYTLPYYYIPSDSNRTAGATDPSLSIDGGATNPQYGYLYNWCAAMNNQPAACVSGAGADGTNQSANDSYATYNVCPLGWRLPTAGEQTALNNAINGGSTADSSGLLANGLWMYSGFFDSTLFQGQGVAGRYWSSTPVVSGYNNRAYTTDVSAGGVTTNRNYWGRWAGLAVRCVAGELPEAEASPNMQKITARTCPVNHTRVRDARDGATYWVRKIGNLCWMETNLAYAGGGDDTYGDTMAAITEDYANHGADYSEARYQIPPGSNRTSGTTNPSTSTDGGVTNPQYGYLYNQCATFGRQTGMCNSDDNGTYQQPNQSANPGNGTVYNVCPAGWRLPTGGANGEFVDLNNSINNGGSITSSSGLRTNGFYMYNGVFSRGMTFSQGNYGVYWTSTMLANSGWLYQSYLDNTSSLPDNAGWPPDNGLAVRCVAG